MKAFNFLRITSVLVLFFIQTQMNWAQSLPDTIMGVSKEQEAEYKKWIDNLYEIGVVIRGDSIIVSEEARKAAVDSQFRRIVYPPLYNWVDAQYLMKQMHLKIGFWYLINLYIMDPANKEPVLRFVVPFDEIFEMDKVLTGVFYTYGLLDPAVATIVNGKPEIHHPEIVEQKLAAVKEMINFILAQRIVKEKKG